MVSSLSSSLSAPSSSSPASYSPPAARRSATAVSSTGDRQASRALARYSQASSRPRTPSRDSRTRISATIWMSPLFSVRAFAETTSSLHSSFRQFILSNITWTMRPSTSTKARPARPATFANSSPLIFSDARYNVGTNKTAALRLSPCDSVGDATMTFSTPSDSKTSTSRRNGLGSRPWWIATPTLKQATAGWSSPNHSLPTSKARAINALSPNSESR